VIVAGSRDFADYSTFAVGMQGYVAKLNVPRDTIIFISGRARTGADDMIIRWCRENDYPWAEYPAQWDDLTVEGAVIRKRRDGTLFNVIAGHQRNGEMAKVATNLMIWWDGKSTGTKDMLSRGKAYKLTLEIVLIAIEPEPKEERYGGQSQSGGSRHPGVRGEAAAW
jgi:hypothetical protein